MHQHSLGFSGGESASQADRRRERQMNPTLPVTKPKRVQILRGPPDTGAIHDPLQFVFRHQQVSIVAYTSTRFSRSS